MRQLIFSTRRKHNFKHKHMIANCDSNKPRQRSNSAALKLKSNICTELRTNETQEMKGKSRDADKFCGLEKIHLMLMVMTYGRMETSSHWHDNLLWNNEALLDTLSLNWFLAFPTFMIIPLLCEDDSARNDRNKGSWMFDTCGWRQGLWLV